MIHQFLENRISTKEKRIKELEAQQKRVQQQLATARRDLKALQADKVNELLTESHMTYEDMAKLLQNHHQQDAPDYH